MRVSKHVERTFARLCLSAVVMFCAASLPLNAQIVTKDDLQNEIATYEAAARQTDASNTAALQAGRIWSHLGTLIRMPAGMGNPSWLLSERCGC
jgi:hypothetical protein